MSKVAREIWLPKKYSFNEEIATLEQLKSLVKEAIQPHYRDESQARVVVIVEVIEL